MTTNNEKNLMKIIKEYKEGRKYLLDTINKQNKMIDNQFEFISEIENDLLKLKDMVIELRDTMKKLRKKK